MNVIPWRRLRCIHKKRKKYLIYGIDLEGPIPELQNEDSVVIPGGRLCLIDFCFVTLRRLLADCFPLGVKSIAWAEGWLERLELVSLPLLL